MVKSELTMELGQQSLALIRPGLDENLFSQRLHYDERQMGGIHRRPLWHSILELHTWESQTSQPMRAIW
jgi:hypothetical protein